MYFNFRNFILCILAFSFVTNAFSKSKSFYTAHLNDTAAVYLTPEELGAKADGKADASDAIQAVINKMQEKSRFGVVFIPQGTYRLTKTIHVWKGIRLIGYGKNRPVFLLAKNTAGFQEGSGKYMVHFTSDRPRENKEIRDANPGTFYSAISNIDFEIQEGNAAAIAIRSHFAQHCFLAHIDFNIGSGKAGVEEVGNEIDDCKFFGGQYGIITSKPSPSWPFLMIDSYFEGQKVAAIETEEGGLTLIRNHFRNVPQAIVVRPDRAEELFMEDCSFENISGPAITISDEYNARPQYNLKNVTCNNVPVLAFFRLSGKKVEAPSKIYKVQDFCHGYQIVDLGFTPENKTTSGLVPLKKMPEYASSDIPQLPAQETWVNLKELGAKGDGISDDTKALQEAINKYQTIFLPTGCYRVTETILLKSNTVLIGLNPITSVIMIKDSTPAFLEKAAAKAVVEVPQGGSNIITGIGIDAGGINQAAVGIKWMAGTNSMINDVKFLGGHGTYDANGKDVPVYNNNRTADGNRNRKWDSQYWSLWITNGGGGTFKDIWTASPYAQAGIYVSNTSAEGRIYAISIEHHVRFEVQLHNVSNWKIYDMQMEEEFGESWHAMPLDIKDCQNLRFANLYLYRVDKMVAPFPYGIKLQNSKAIEFCGIHVYSPTKFSYDNTLYDATHDFYIRSREIANLKVSGNDPVQKQNTAKVVKIAGGFEFIDAMTADPKGNIYFSDSRWHFIYRWSPETNDLKLVSDIALSPLSMAFDKSGNLIVVSKMKKVFSFNPENPTDLKELLLVSAQSRPGTIALFPGHRWKDEHDFLTRSIEKPEQQYVSEDSSVFIPKNEDLWRAYTLRGAITGDNIYIADEFGQKTVMFKVQADGQLTDPKQLAEEGELDVAADKNGNIYVAAGSIFVYDKTGKQIEVIETPERPTSIIFGGKERKTLFIGARSSLYKLEMK